MSTRTKKSNRRQSKNPKSKSSGTNSVNKILINKPLQDSQKIEEKPDAQEEVKNDLSHKEKDTNSQQNQQKPTLPKSLLDPIFQSMGFIK